MSAITDARPSAPAEPQPAALPERRPLPRAGMSAEPRFHCATCEIEIIGRPTIHVVVAFCCAGCVAGGPCTCSYDMLPEPPPDAVHGWRIHDCLDLTALDDELAAVAAARR